MISLYESILDDEESILNQGDMTASLIQWKERLTELGILTGYYADKITVIPISEDKFALKYDTDFFEWIIKNKEIADLLRNHCEYIETPIRKSLKIYTECDLDFENLIKFRCDGKPVRFEEIRLHVKGEAKLSNIDSDTMPLIEHGWLIISGPGRPGIYLMDMHWDGKYYFLMDNVNVRETKNVKLVRDATRPQVRQFRFQNVLWPNKVDDSIIYYVLGMEMEFWDFQYSNGVVTIEDTNGTTINSTTRWDNYRVKKIYAKKQHAFKWIYQKYLKIFESDKIQNLYVDFGSSKSFVFDTYKLKPQVKRYMLTSRMPRDLKFKAWCDTSEDKDINWNQYEAGRAQNNPVVSSLYINAFKVGDYLLNCESNCSMVEIEVKNFSKLFINILNDLPNKDKIPQKLLEEYINFNNFPNLKYIVLAGCPHSLKRIDDEYWGLFK